MPMNTTYINITLERKQTHTPTPLSTHQSFRNENPLELGARPSFKSPHTHTVEQSFVCAAEHTQTHKRTYLLNLYSIGIVGTRAFGPSRAREHSYALISGERN